MSIDFNKYFYYSFFLLRLFDNIKMKLDKHIFKNYLFNFSKTN